MRSELTIVEGQLSELTGRAARLTAERDGLTSLAFPADILALARTSEEVIGFENIELISDRPLEVWLEEIMVRPS